MVAQGLSCPGRNIDYLWNRNKPFPSEKEHFVESPEKLTWIGYFGFVAQEPWPGNIFVESKLPPVREYPGLPNLQLPGSVSGVVPLKIKETRTTGSDLKGKRTRVDDEPDGSTSQSPLRRSNYGRTTPPKSQFTFPAAAHDITNHHVASSSGTCNPSRQYSLEDQENLILAVAIHGRKWQEIKKMLKGPGRSGENWKEKWRDMLRHACCYLPRHARNNMDENKKSLHIVAAAVQFMDEKHSKFKQEFPTLFQQMGNEDREKMASAKEWLSNLKAEMFICTDINHARLRWGHIFQKKI